VSLLPSRAPEPSRRPLLAVGVAGLAGGAVAAALAARLLRPGRAAPADAAAQGLMAGAAVLALAVALDSGLEHYRGAYQNRAMFAAPAAAGAALAASLPAMVSAAPGRGRAAAPAFAAAIATGGAGIGFHLYDIARREGGLDWANLFYAAPLGAPAALALAGSYGLFARALDEGRTELRGIPAGKLLGPLVAASLAGTVAEAGLLHFRGAFQNPIMYAPVTVPPLAAAAIAVAPFRPKLAPAARWLLRATAALGLAGPIFHAYGIHRNMGGWRNWSQMLLQGPPLPAPPAFFAIAAAGLGLLPLIEEEA
jgi:hypothetical protein